VSGPADRPRLSLRSGQRGCQSRRLKRTRTPRPRHSRRRRTYHALTPPRAMKRGSGQVRHWAYQVGLAASRRTSSVTSPSSRKSTPPSSPGRRRAQTWRASPASAKKPRCRASIVPVACRNTPESYGRASPGLLPASPERPLRSYLRQDAGDRGKRQHGNRGGGCRVSAGCTVLAGAAGSILATLNPVISEELTELFGLGDDLIGEWTVVLTPETMVSLAVLPNSIEKSVVFKSHEPVPLLSATEGATKSTSERLTRPDGLLWEV
jgi:hypothetical protein